jgi:enoyl-CoA hydratase
VARLEGLGYRPAIGWEGALANGIEVVRDGQVTIIVLNRPEVLNAWDRAMRREITALLAEADSDPATEAAVITGSGDRAFGAGQDLREAAMRGPAEIDAWVEEWRVFFGALRGCGKPTVAALNGVVAGSSLQFALMADARIGHQGVRMGQPEIKSGVASSMGPWILQTMLGPMRATDLVLSGRLMDAAECERLGLIDRLVAREEVRDAAVAHARSLAAQPKLAFRLTKERLRALTEPGFQESFTWWKELLRRSQAGT